MSLFKQVIIMRTDLNMRKGKMIAQGAHASFGALYQMSLQYLPFYHEWLLDGGTVICVGIDNLDDLLKLSTEAALQKLPYHVVQDAGRTEFKEPTITCVAIGPGPSETIDKITRHLKLL